MKAPYFIEILSANGDLVQRQQFASLPIRLGRAYDNDLILDDAHAAAEHAVIDAYDDQHLMLRDLGSRNGTVHGGKRHSTVILGGDTVVRLGQTTLRVRGADFPVPPEVSDTTRYDWEGTKPALAGLGLIALTAVVSNWLGDIQRFDIVRYLLVIVYGMAAGLVWGAVWALANRLFSGGMRFGRHLFILGCGLAAMELWTVASHVVAYAYSLEGLTRYGSHVLVAIVCTMIFFHLGTIKPQHPRRFATTGVVLFLISSSFILINNLQAKGRLGDELYMSVLLPPAVRQSPDHSVAEFFGNAARLKSSVDADRLKSLRDGGANDEVDSDDSDDDDDSAD